MRKKKNDNPQFRLEKRGYLLTLDQRWHTLFANNKTRKMKMLEHKLNELIKLQGKCTNDYKEFSLLKKKIMHDIIEDMPETFGSQDENSYKTMDKNKNYIKEINEKLETIERKLEQYPNQIEDMNGKLLELSMSSCYKRMSQKKVKLVHLNDEIENLRDQLKELVIKRNENKEEYDLLYTYMHDMVGPTIIEEFDKIYLGGNDLD